MITLKSAVKNPTTGLYVCDIEVNSIGKSVADAQDELNFVLNPNFKINPQTMAVSFDYGVPDVGSSCSHIYELETEGVAGLVVDQFLKTHVAPPDGTAFVFWEDLVPVNMIDGELEVVSNGEYNSFDHIAETGQVAWTRVSVNVPSAENIQINKTVSITENGTTVISPDVSYDAMSQVSVSVNVPSTENIQTNKIVSITENGTIIISPDASYNAMSQASVTVNVPDDPKIGTVIGTPTEIQQGEGDPEMLYCVEYNALKALIDASDELIFKLSDSQYTRPLMGVYNSSDDTHFEIADYLPAQTGSTTVTTKIIYVIRNEDGDTEHARMYLTDEQRNFLRDNLVSKVPYNIYNYYT